VSLENIRTMARNETDADEETWHDRRLHLHIFAAQQVKDL
jgi:hypothetical protein